ncbi:MAG: TolC family protein [Rhodocyclales bacterium]|nr:TolC family protein [Rhodocyclales bacterium]
MHAVGDKLVEFLGGAVAWVDVPAARVPLAGLRSRIQAAVAGHPEVRLAQEQRDTAAYATREAYAGFLPQVSASVDGGRRTLDAVQTPWTFVPAHEQKTTSVGFTARQLLYDFGAVGGRVDAQEARETAADARSTARRSELALRSLMAWHEMFRGRQALKLSQMNTLSRQQILSFIEEREQLGGSSKSDVLRARARVADAQAAEVVAENRLRAAEAVYREIFEAAPPVELPLPEAAAVELARFADLGAWVEKNALLAEIRAQAEAADFEAKSAAAAMLPSISFDVSVTRRDMNGGTGVIPGVDKSMGLVFKHNLYSGGAEQARAQQAVQKAKEARLELENQRRQLERAFAQTLAEVRTSNAAILARKEAVQVAAAALGSVREQFAFRRGTLLDMLRAQEELYIAGRDLIDIVVDHALARYRLLHLSMELSPLVGIAPGEGVAKD